MFKFRHHRGSLEDSLATELQFNNLSEFRNYLLSKSILEFIIEYYCYDDRVSTYIFIVKCKNTKIPIGFCY